MTYLWSYVLSAGGYLWPHVLSEGISGARSVSGDEYVQRVGTHP